MDRARPLLPLGLLALGLLPLALLALAAACSESPGPAERAPAAAPPLSEALPESELTDEQRAEIEALEALGYLDGDRPGEAVSGVRIHDRERAWPGWNLYTSDHSPRVFLIDMDGTLVHEWIVGHRDPERRTTPRRVRALADGTLLVLLEKLGLVKLDRDGREIWRVDEDFHHDFDVAPDGTIFVLGRKAEVFPRYHERRAILNDIVWVLAPDGTVRETFSVLEAFERSPEAREILRPGIKGDVFHSNTLVVLDGRLADVDPAFRAGNLLTSWRELDRIGIYDPGERAVVWTLAGPFRAQHRPSVTRDGHILLFDNLDVGRGPHASRLVELDPRTGEVAWEFHSTPQHPFFSETGGACTELPNGNKLATETRAGRVHEVTREGDVVWLYVNPARRADGSMPRIFEMLRLPPSYGGWLQER